MNQLPTRLGARHEIALRHRALVAPPARSGICPFAIVGPRHCTRRCRRENGSSTNPGTPPRLAHLARPFFSSTHFEMELSRVRSERTTSDPASCLEDRHLVAAVICERPCFSALRSIAGSDAAGIAVKTAWIAALGSRELISRPSAPSRRLGKPSRNFRRAEPRLDHSRAS